MPKFVHADVLDQGPNVIKTAAVRMLLVSAYAAGDSYAAVQAAKLAEVVMASGDYTFSASGNNRVLTVAAGKTAALTAAATGTDYHYVFTDNASRVLWATPATGSPTTGAIGATVTFASVSYTASQPA